MINLSSFIHYHSLNTPDRVALVYQDERISYAAFDDRIARIGGWLTQRGIGAGDVVGCLMKNSVAFLELAFAVSHIGAVFLPINFRLSPAEVGYIVSNAGVKLLFTDEEFQAGREQAVEKVLVGPAAQRGLLALAGDVPPIAATARQPQDLFRLMYTSGTTDHPKGVMHSYENFYSKCADHLIVLELSSRTRLLVVGPLYHVGAFDLPGIAVLWAGGTLVILREFDPAEVLETIQKEAINGAWFAPVMTNVLLAYPERGQYDVSSLEWAIGGGERTPESRIRTFSDYFTNARYVDAYGLTESCSGDTFMAKGMEIAKIGSTGRATPHVEITIRNDEGDILKPGETGEICLRGPKITKGYWNDPAKTAASFFGDWFRTGDVGHLDEDGFLYITDRRKDMIISGGENIASSEIERVLYELPQIREAAVIGLPDDRWGERPVAVVVLAPGAELDLETLRQHCRASLAGFKVPGEMIIREALPRNPSGKILKRELRATIAGAQSN
jgi:fatty-acyl-CoA synthase